MAKHALAVLSTTGGDTVAGAGETAGALGAVSEVGAWPTAGALAKTLPVAFMPAAALGAGAGAVAVQHAIHPQHELVQNPGLFQYKCVPASTEKRRTCEHRWDKEVAGGRQSNHARAVQTGWERRRWRCLQAPAPEKSTLVFCKPTRHETRQFSGSGGTHVGANELLKACCSACKMQRSVWLRSLTDTVLLLKD